MPNGQTQMAISVKYLFFSNLKAFCLKIILFYTRERDSFEKAFYV
jgi:hypothetical protein